MRLKHLPVVAACGLIISLTTPATLNATTFVSMDEQDLAAASTAVVTGWVTGVESHADPATGGVNTYVSIEPTNLLAGALPDGEIVLRERGGRIAGRSEKIFGAPEYAIGEQVVAFLSQDADGSLHTTAMALGKYTLASGSGGTATVSRQLNADVRVLDRGTGRVRGHLAPEVVDLRQFVRHVRIGARRLHRRHHTRPARLTPPELGVTVPHAYESPFTYLGNPSRWFEPDFGQPVLYRIDATGDARNGAAASRSAVNNAFAAWTNVPSSSLVLGDGGLLSAPLPFTGCDGGSRVVFNDPFNEIGDPTGCGGILAIGGYCTTTESKTVSGTTFQRITLGKVVFNNGWEQCGIWSECNLAEVATHEIGHTIGLGHSGDNTATMAAVVHFDGRCASVSNDDIAAVEFIYPSGGVPIPTAVPTAPPTATSTVAPPPPTPAPTSSTGVRNDTCANAQVVESAPYTNTVLTTTATIDAADPIPACGNGSRSKSVWYSFTAPSTGTVTANTFGTSYDTILAAYTGSCGAFRPVPGACNDDSGGRQSRVAFQTAAGTTYYFLSTAYGNTGGSQVFQLTFQGTGNTATPTRTVTPRPPTPTSTTGPAATATAPPVAPPATPTVGAPAPTATSAPQPPGPPAAVPNGCPNDSCMTPMDITTTPFSYSMVTTAATVDPSDPAPWCGNRSRAKSVWFRFSAPTSGTVSADTFGSNYDTILAAFAKSGETLTPVTGACNDDTGSMQSRVTFQASAGVSYYFLVTAYSNNGGALGFHLSQQGAGGGATPTWTPLYLPSATPTAAQPQPPPPAATPTWTPVAQNPVPPSSNGLANDVCTTATEIPAAPHSSRMTTSLARAEAMDPAPACGNQTRSRSVWYRYTAPANGTLAANTYGSNYDTLMAAYAGACGALTQVACNDDSGGTQSRVAFQAVAGTTYYFQVAAYRGDGGTLVFQLTN